MTGTPTKQRLKAIRLREFAKYEWAEDETRLSRAMSAVDATLGGSRSCALTDSGLLAWKELGLKGRPTYMAIHALPEGGAA